MHVYENPIPGQVHIQPVQPQAPPTSEPAIQPQVTITQRTNQAGKKALNSTEILPRRASLGDHKANIEKSSQNAKETTTGVAKKRNSLILVAGGRSIQLAINGDKSIIAPIRSQIAVKIPNDAALKLTSWFVKHDKALRKANESRIPYSQQDIAPALERFEKEFHCSWHEMKHGCSEKDSKFLQIINDLRACYLEEVFDSLRSDFPNLTIDDFGSSKLTSDRDFALGGFGADRQTMNTMIDKHFNAKFEAIWKAPSAIIFDSNAYTTQHVMTAADPQIEESRSHLQHEGSLLMKLRNGTTESWENFKSATLAQISDPKLQKQQSMEFDKIEKRNKELELRLNQEILKLALGGSHHVAVKESIGKYVNTPIHLLPENAINDINAAAKAIKASDPHIEVQGSNNLYEGIKTGYGVLEKERLDLFSALKDLGKLTTEAKPIEFAETFNATTESFIKKLNKEMEKLEARLGSETEPGTLSGIKNQMQDLKNHIDYLKNTMIQKGDENGVMRAFKDRTSLEQAEKGLQEKRIELEGHAVHLKKLEKSLAELTSKTGPGGSSNDLTKIENSIAKLKTHYGAKSLSELSSKIGEEIGKVSSLLNGIREKRSNLEEEHGSFWDQAGAIGVEGDRLLIDMQRSHLEGMCFAQEAHVSEGAIGFVVFNLQAGKTDIRSLEQYTQAFIEISGYCSGHQSKMTTPHGSMVEASKYAERLGAAIDHINERAAALKIPSPPLGESTQLIAFFKKIAHLRGKGISEENMRSAVENNAREMGLIAPEGHFDQEALKKVNQQIDHMTGTLEAWLKTNAGNQRNAYYSK